MRTLTSAKRGFTLVELLVVIAVIGILVALLLPAIQAARESARRTQCTNNLKQIGMAYQSYHDSFGAFPFAGDNGPSACCSADAGHFTRYNWTYHILPFIEQQNLYEFGSKNRAELRRGVVDSYYCPTRRSPRLYRNLAKCDYAVNRATGSNGIAIRSTTDVIGMASVIDGTSNTLLAAENRAHLGYLDSGQNGYWSDNEDCFVNGWADEVNRSSSEVPEPDLIQASLPGSLVHNQFGSAHPAGITSVLVDGSVRIIYYEVNLQPWRYLCNRHDREPFEVSQL